MLTISREKPAPFPWAEFCALCFAAGCAAGTLTAEAVRYAEEDAPRYDPEAFWPTYRG